MAQCYKTWAKVTILLISRYIVAKLYVGRENVTRMYILMAAMAVITS